MRAYTYRDGVREEHSAGVVVHRHRNGKRQFLFLKRKAGWLDFPKGHIEKGEDEEDAAIRETAEESGLNVTLIPFFKRTIHYTFTDDGVKAGKYVTMFLSHGIDRQKPRVSDEHTGIEWLGMDTALRQLSYSGQKRVLKEANEYLDRYEKMANLNKEYARLPLRTAGWDLSRRFVTGEGSLDSKVLVLGQAPGRNEDVQGRPFIGAAGKLLNSMIDLSGMKRGDIYITSVVQFFPPDNRVPTDKETELCIGFLKGQIEIVRPKLIVLLGSYTAKSILGKKHPHLGNGILNAHGTFVDGRFLGARLFLTIHPAAAVRMKKHVPVIRSDFEKLRGIVKKLQ
jgi:DNA polymerase